MIRLTIWNPEGPVQPPLGERAARCRRTPMFELRIRLLMMSLALRQRALFSLSAGLCLVVLTQSDCSAQGHYGYNRYYGYVRPYGGYGYGGFGGGMTPAMGAGIGMGAAAQGMGQFAVDMGQYEKEHQEANMQYLQAYQEYLQTVGLQHDTYQKLLQEHQAEYQAKIATARANVEAYKRDISSRAAPHRLTEEQFDRAHDIIHWPLVLRNAMFDEDRFTIDKLFQERTPADSGAGSNTDAAIQKATQSMLKTLGDDVNNLNIDQYTTGRHFITSLAYESRFPLDPVRTISTPPRQQ
jgi:hypothetical protein